MGASVPLLVLGLLSCATLRRNRNGLLRGARVGKAVLGVFLLVTAVRVLAARTNGSSPGSSIIPAWLTHLTTRY